MLAWLDDPMTKVHKFYQPPKFFPLIHTDTMAENDVDSELLDYEEDEEPQGAPESAAPSVKKEVKGSYVSIHSSGFRDFLLKPELLRAIIDCGFEHPSEGNGHLIIYARSVNGGLSNCDIVSVFIVIWVIFLCAFNCAAALVTPRLHTIHARQSLFDAALVYIH